MEVSQFCLRLFSFHLYSHSLVSELDRVDSWQCIKFVAAPICLNDGFCH